MFAKSKHGAKLPIAALVVVGLVFAIFAGNASAESYCGPAFHSKKEAVDYYKENPAARAALRSKLLKHSKSTHYHADQGVIQYLEQPNVKYFKAPKGYKLKGNTYCPNGPGDYDKYPGKLDVGGISLLWYCHELGGGGRKCSPLLKGYCRNFVTGATVKHGQKKHKKCKCKKKKKKHKKPPPKITCEAQGMITVAGNCVSQSNGKQDCEAKGNNWHWDGNQCVQINVVCGNVIVGSGNTDVDQGGNCYTVVTPPPPPCTTNCHPEEPEPKPEPPAVEWERIQEVYTDKERRLCVTTTPNSVVSAVQFAVAVGERSNGGNAEYRSNINKWCVQYTAPSEKPPRECQEEWISDKLPPGTKCDVAHVAVFTNNGAGTVKGTMEIPILEEDEVVVW